MELHLPQTIPFQYDPIEVKSTISFFTKSVLNTCLHKHKFTSPRLFFSHTHLIILFLTVFCASTTICQVQTRTSDSLHNVYFYEQGFNGMLSFFFYCFVCFARAQLGSLDYVLLSRIHLVWSDVHVRTLRDATGEESSGDLLSIFKKL